MFIRNDGYTGFSFNGVHSSTLGIYRVTESNRLNVPLTPSIKDISLDIPGADYEVFFGSNYKETKFGVQIAFADISEVQFRRLVEFYKTKKPYPLIFDENPYKIYMAKGDGAFDLKYVCFGEDSKDRYYAGEAKLTFTCRTPYAFSRYNFSENFEKANLVEWQDRVNDATIMQTNFVEDPTDTSEIFYGEDEGSEILLEQEAYDFSNKVEWEEASEIQNKGQYNIPYTQGGQTKIKIYNSGDLPMPISIRLKFIDDCIPTCALWVNESSLGVLSWSDIERDTSKTKLNSAQDKFIEIDTRNNSVNGEDESYRNTDRSYLQYFSGSYMTAPPGENTIVFSNTTILPYIDGVSYKFRYF